MGSKMQGSYHSSEVVNRVHPEFEACTQKR